MKKYIKSDYIHFKVTEDFKEKVIKRSEELNKKDVSDYIRSLLERDISSVDMSATEKPRMREFAQMVADEFGKINERQIKLLNDSIESKSNLIRALVFWTHRVLLYCFFNLGMRLKAIGNFKSEDLKTIDDEAIRNVNSSFSKYLDMAYTNDAETINNYLKKPM